MKKKILIFGSTSFIAKEFSANNKEYIIHPVSRRANTEGLYFDFDQLNQDSINQFISKLTETYDSIIFFQGINPSIGFESITDEHFQKMFRINISGPALILKNIKPFLNDNASVIFFSSVSKSKGSYDPAYAAAKSALIGLIQSLSNVMVKTRFNVISLGLVENSPVFNQMTSDFRLKHSEKMYDNKFIDVKNVTNTISFLINNNNINRSEIPVDGGNH